MEPLDDAPHSGQQMPRARLKLRVQPRASADEVAGFMADGALRVRVTAPPADGKANAAVERTLAKALGVPRRHVTIVRGASSREKVAEVEGMDDAEARLRLA